MYRGWKMARKKKELPPVFEITGEYEARCVDVYDGDTITVVFDPFPDSQYSKEYSFKVRLLGIDTPELKISAKDPNRDRLKAMGVTAGNYLREMILDKDITVNIVGNEKYGRSLAYVKYGDIDVSSHMITGGYAVPYEGKTKYDWSLCELYPICD